ncbi:MAG: toxin-antitoxin system YwqK family antitoxin [Flavobacteriales bacterium]
MKSVFLSSCLFLVACLTVTAQPVFTQYRDDNGKVSSEGYLRDGKPDGYWKTFYPNGKIKTEGKRENFQLDSTWNFYSDGGMLQKSIDYKNNERNGWERLYDDKGNKSEEYFYVKNIKEGKANWYYPTGELKKQSQFVNNKEEGKAVEYERDGRIITLLTYRSGFIYTEERINRYDSQGKRSGIWRDLYEDGKLRQEGNWLAGMKNGVFKFYTSKGVLEKMERYENDVLIIDEASTAILDIRKQYHENGELKEVGTYREGKKQGNFRLYDESGKEAGGLLYDSDVLVGEGMIDSLGRRVGEWKLFYPDGRVRAAGRYIAGQKEGGWSYFYANGKIEQSGTYKMDWPNGSWKWYHANGQLHREEMYRNGKEDGASVEYDSTGVIINEGEYTAGRRNGKWKLTIHDHIEEGQYADGERDGLWMWYYGSGKKMFEGEFQMGIPINKHKYWYDNGQIEKTGKYEAGEMEGRWDYFDINGFPSMQLDYREGKVVRINGQKIRLPEGEKE